MATSQLTISVALDTRYFRAWLALLKWLSPLLGPDRTWRWAVRVGYRLIRVKVGRGSWERPFHWSEDGS